MGNIKKVKYKETQKFRQKWIWAIMFGLLGLSFWGIYQQLFLEKPFGNNPTNDYSLIILSILPISLNLLFYYTKLEFKITEEKIIYQFFPFNLKAREISWSLIEAGEVKKYNPLKEYGGWGIKYGKYGKAYNVSGNMGLELKYKDKKKTVLFGTQKPQELKKVISQLIEKGIIK